MLLTVKGNQKTLLRQIQCQFQGKRQIPFTATAQSKKHGRDTLWEMRAKEAPEHIKENWPGVSWIIAMISTTVTRRGHQPPQAHYFLTSLRTKPEALLRLIRQRWSIENEWHWPRDTQLHEDAHRGDFQERCHSWAATQAAWIKFSSRIGLGSSIGLLIHTSSGWSQQRVLRLQRVGLARRAAS